MRTLTDIKQDIERLSDRRAEVLARLSNGHDASLAAEHKRLNDELAERWEEQRIVRATIRFGDRVLIIRRPGQEERLSRGACPEAHRRWASPPGQGRGRHESLRVRL